MSRLPRLTYTTTLIRYTHYTPLRPLHLHLVTPTTTARVVVVGVGTALGLCAAYSSNSTLNRDVVGLVIGSRDTNTSNGYKCTSTNPTINSNS